MEGKSPDAEYPKISIGSVPGDYQMELVSGTSATGIVYQYKGNYPLPEDGTVTGTIVVTTSTNIYTKDINFWTANIPPILTWIGGTETGYTNDGVQPNIGTAGTVFTFRIRYTDPEGGTPQGISLQPVNIAMNSVGSGIYECTGTFSLGEHSYWFSASDSIPVIVGGSVTVAGAPAGGNKMVVGNDIDTGIFPQLATFLVSIGTLTSVNITGTDTVGIEGTATFTAHAVNELNMEIEGDDVGYLWEIIEGTGSLTNSGSKTVTLTAGTNTGTIILKITAFPAGTTTLQGDDVINTKTIIIKPGKPQALFFSGTETNTITVELPVKSLTGFAVSGRDGYGNVTPVVDCIWRVDGAIGTLNTTTGSAATFTAEAVVGTGTVVVSTGTLTATANITVIAGEFHHFDISVIPTPIHVDGSMTITLLPKDTGGNTFTIHEVSPPALKIIIATVTVNLGTCAVNTPVEFPWPAGLRNKLGTGTIYALENKGTSSSFQVVSGSPHHFKIISPATNTAVYAGSTTAITAQLQDMYDNSAALGTSACVIFQSDSSGTFTADAINSTSPGTITVQTGATGLIAGIYQPNFSSGSKAMLVGVSLTSDNRVSGTSGAVILTIPAALSMINVVIPSTVTAGIPATISVVARDNYNNIATGTLTFSGSLGTITSTKCIITGGIVNGFSWQDSGTWTGTISFTKAQTPAILNITAQNGKTGTTTFAVLPAEPHSLQATGATTYNGSCGEAWTIGVRLKDVYGNLIGNKNINWEIISSPSNATLSATVSTTNQAGETSVIFTLGTKTGTYSVKAYPEGFPAISATFIATAGVGSPTLVPGSYPSIATVTNKITLEVISRDTSGNPFQGRVIQWQILSGATLSPLTSTTDNQGIATTSLTLGTKTGVSVVTAKNGALTATFTITALPDEPAAISTSITPQTMATVNSSVGLSIKLSDKWGNPVGTTTVNWQMQGLPATSTQTINGTTSLVFTLGTKTGVSIVTATAGTVTATITITALPDEPATISTFITPQAVAVVNSSVGLSIKLSDKWGNPAATTTVNWQSQGLAGTSTQTINGTATLVFTLGTKTGVSIITATAGTLTATFTITAIAGTMTLSQNFTIDWRTVDGTVLLEVSLRDMFGNPGSGTALWSLLEPLPATASLSGTSTPIDPQTGSSSVTLHLGTKTGDYRVMTRVNNYTATFMITAEPGQAGTMATGYVPATARVNTTLPLTIGLYDLYGNPVFPTTVDWNAAGLPATSTQTINGTATLLFTLGTRTGIYTINASYAGRNATFTITASPGTPTISQNLINCSGTVGGTVNLEIALRDEFGNVAFGTATWTLVQMPATASLSATSTLIGSQTGSSSVTLSLGTKTGDYQVRAQVDDYTATFTINVKSDNPATNTSYGTFTGTATVDGTMTFTVSLYDKYGNIISSGNINWIVTRGTITTATATTTISNGKTEYLYRVNRLIGTYTISVRFGAILLKQFSIRVNPGSPTLSSTLTTRYCLPSENITLEVFFRDGFGNPCPGTVTWNLIEPLPGTASLSATSTPVGSQTGSATITFIAGTMTGNYMITAAINGQTATFTITVQTRSTFDSKELLIYPNPIRVQEWDKYKYPAGPWVKFGSFNGNVTLRIYDISGNLIRIMENVPPETDGFVKWDMKNQGTTPGESGLEVNSGIYLCITTCNGEKRIGRFAVIK
ncbi:Ig-like domain-containing protein [Candidatus Desantisbacteria bacterium]|nr:Ig-like domain-containing protein [Candidatus Desantisbacteria bacterium]